MHSTERSREIPSKLTNYQNNTTPTPADNQAVTLNSETTRTPFNRRSPHDDGARQINVNINFNLQGNINLVGSKSRLRSVSGSKHVREFLEDGAT